MNGLSKLIKYGIYISAVMPLIIFSQYISPFHFGKMVIFRGWIEILFVLYLILVFQDRSYLPRRTPLLTAVVFFTLAFGLATLTSVNYLQSFWGTLERMGGWFSFIHFTLLFIMLSAVFRSKEDWINLIKISLVVCLLSIFYGLLQKTNISWIIGSGGRQKIFGTLGNSALFAGYVIINAFLALMFSFLSGITKWWKIFSRIFFALAFVAVILTGVRGSAIGVVLGTILFGLIYSHSLNARKVKLFTLTFVVLMMSVVGILFLARNTQIVRNNGYLARYSDLSPTSYTVQTRFWAWSAGFDGFNDSIKAAFLGYGPENFNIPFSKHFNPNFFKGPGSETLFDRAHNQFLEILFTMGLIGLAAYLLIFVRAFQGIKKVTSSNAGGAFSNGSDHVVIRASLFSGLVAYIIHNSFIFDTSANYLVFFVVLGFINFLYLAKGEEGERALTPPSKPWMNQALAWTLGIIIFIPVCWLIYFSDIEPTWANRATTYGIVYGWNKADAEAYNYFKDATSYNVPGKYEFRNRYVQYILDKTASEKIDASNTEKLQFAIELEKKNVDESPQDYLPLLYLSRIYINLGKDDPKSPYNDLALENSMKALEVAPTFIRTYYEIAQAYINKGDSPHVIEYFQKAVDLNPNAGISWWYLAISLYDTGQKEAGLNALNKMYETGYTPDAPSDILKIVTVYVEQKDYPKVLFYYKILSRMDPQNAQIHASLAASYAQLGMNDEAVAEARIAAQLDPKFEPEAKAFAQALGKTW